VQPLSPLFEQYADLIAALPERSKFSRTELLIPQFRLFEDTGLEIYYAPFDFVNMQAKVAIVGITPGWTQMEIAFRQARAALRNGLTATEASQKAKVEASFAGAMRNNLITMLNEIHLSDALGMKSCENLFSDCSQSLHPTSAIRYPAFVSGRNYTGHTPDLLSNPVLARFIDEMLAPELSSIPDALVIPLGKCVDTVLQHLIKVGVLDAKRCLLGFPHPSGTNGHRRLEFEQGQSMLTRIINRWANM
jgi:hypothetical protein